jgi:hypothetical protein
MNIKLLRSVALAAAITIGGSVALFAVEAPKEDAAMAAKLVLSSNPLPAQPPEDPVSFQ